MSVISPLKEKFPNAQIFWVTKEEFKSIVGLSKNVEQIITLAKGSGLKELLKLAFSLRRDNFDLVYDAHSNLRSFVLRVILGTFSKTKILRRPKDRFKRILLFWFKKNLFPKPFRGIKSYLAPLASLQISQDLKTLRIENELNGKFFDQYIVLAPSAAWELKRWPLEYWKKLIDLLPNKKFLVLGGPTDNFCSELEQVDPIRCLSLAGRLSLKESAQVVSKAELVISGDTGIIHIADLLGVKGILLIGPSAFGFTTGDHIKILERPLWCRPCTKDGRGKCHNPQFKKCLMDIHPGDVAYLANSFATKRS